MAKQGNGAAPRAPTDNQEESASASNHSAFLIDLSRVDIECKTTRSVVTRNELFGRGGIDLCHTSPWNQDDCLTCSGKGLSSSDTIAVEAGSFSSPHPLSIHDLPKQRQQALSHNLPHEDKSRRSPHYAYIVPGGRISPTIMDVGTHETLTTAEYVGHDNNTTVMGYPSTIDEGMDILLSINHNDHPLEERPGTG